MSKNDQGMDVHPIGKQFQKLCTQEKYKGNVKKRIECMAGFIIDQSFWPWMDDFMYDSMWIILQKIQEKVLSKESMSNEFIEFRHFVFNAYVAPYLMDLYAISRILHRLPKSEIKIYASGFAHIHIFENFLKQFYPDLHGNYQWNEVSSKLR